MTRRARERRVRAVIQVVVVMRKRGGNLENGNQTGRDHGNGIDRDGIDPGHMTDRGTERDPETGPVVDGMTGNHQDDIGVGAVVEVVAAGEEGEIGGTVGAISGVIIAVKQSI